MKEYDDLIKSIDRYIEKADDDLSDTLKDEGFIDPEKTVDEINSLEEAICDILEEQRDSFIKEMKEKDLEEIIDDIIPALMAGDISDGALGELFEREFTNIMGKLTDAYIKEIDKDLAFEMFTERTTDWIKSWSKDLGEIMKLSTHDGLKQVLSTALDNGDSVQTVTDDLIDWYGFSRKRAKATAITEMLTAHSAAANEAFKQSPAVEKKKWRHTGAYKNRPRSNHVAMDGQEVPANGKFKLEGMDGKVYEPEYPRDPILPAAERVNCHCISQAVISSDIMGLSADERRALQQQAIDEDNGEWEKELNAKNKAKAGIK